MVNALPVIVGFGGYNAAGRSSSHQAFRRMVLESLSVAEQQQTVVSLACLMARVTKEGQGYRDASGQLLTAAEVDSRYRADIINGTLIRRIESFDPARVPGNKKISLTQAQGSDIFELSHHAVRRHFTRRMAGTRDFKFGSHDQRMTKLSIHVHRRIRDRAPVTGYKVHQAKAHGLHTRVRRNRVHLMNGGR